MVTQHKKNKPGIKYDDTIDIEHEDEKEQTINGSAILAAINHTTRLLLYCC